MAAKAITAGILIIGNEILSGTTQDANIAFLGKRLADKGIKLAEVRIVRDEEAAIVAALNALRSTYTYVFTTGGIGPTHDDITAESISVAFGVPCEINEEARADMEKNYAARGIGLNEGRLRMARVPKGGTPIFCSETVAPGFRKENVFTMAGVPRIMQAQYLAVEPLLESGEPVLARTLQCNLKEGDIAFALEDIQKAHPTIDIGSYPHMGQMPSLSLIARGTDVEELNATQKEIAEMIRKYGEEPIFA